MATLDGLIVDEDREEKIGSNPGMTFANLSLSYIRRIGGLEDFSYVPRVRRTSPLLRVRGKSSELSNRPKGAEFCARRPGQFRRIGGFRTTFRRRLVGAVSKSLAYMTVAVRVELLVGRQRIAESRTFAAGRALVRLEYSSGT